MSSSIVLKMLNITHYFRNKKAKRWFNPYQYEANDINLNKISLHLYQGESLAIIGEPGSSKSFIGRILAGDVKPDKGKVICSGTLYFGDIKDKHLIQATVFNYVNTIVKLFPYEVSDHKVSQIIKYAHLDTKQQQPVFTLTHAEYAQLIVSIARASAAEIIILNHIIENIPETYLPKAVELSNDYVDNNLTMIIIDDDIDKVIQVSNYVAWISHGQLRMEGSINQVIPKFREHERDRLSLEDEVAIENFDIDWKKSRAQIPEMTYNFKRVERYKHAQAPVYIVKFWTILISLVLGMVVMFALIFTNTGNIQLSNNLSQSKIQNQNVDPYEEKLAYGLALNGKIHLHGNNELTAPKYSLLTIIGENSKNYRVKVDNKNYYVAKNKLEYFNPAALYEEHKFTTMSKYMKSNYGNFVDYFNSHLNKSHKTVKKTLVPDKENRFVVDITEQPIEMLFNDTDKLKGFVFPIVKKDELKKEFNISKDIWITKTYGGYLIADMKENKWIFIEL